MDSKQQKKAQQESNQKASLMNKSDMPFFCTTLEEAQGDFQTVIDCTKKMNTPILRKTEIIRDISHISKLVLSINDHQMVLVTYVPPDKYDQFNAKTWMDHILQPYPHHRVEDEDPSYAYATITDDIQNDVSVFKLRDTIISDTYRTLRKDGFLPEANQDDDNDILLGEDAFL